MKRISSNMQYNDMQFSLRRQESRLAKVNNQLSTQRRIGTLRDDPLAAGHSVRYQSYLNRLERFEKNAKTVNDQFKIAEGYMNQSLQIMQRIRELAVQGAHGVYTPGDLKNMAPEVDELLKELIMTANAVGPDGVRVFSGTKSFTEPFETVSGDVDGAGSRLVTAVRYNGSVDPREIEIDEQNFIRNDHAGNRTFWAEQMSLFSGVNSGAYQVLQDTSIEIDGVTVALSAGDTVHAIIAKINDSGAAVKAGLDPVTNGLNLQTTDARQLWIRDLGDSTVLSDLGLVNAGQRPPYNLAPSVRVSGGSAFDAVLAFRDSLYAGNQEAIGGRVLGSIDGAIDNLATRLAENGSRYERAQTVLSRLNTQIPNVQAAESREADLDFTKAITDLKMYEYTHQAALSTAGKLYSNTLLNYLR